MNQLLTIRWWFSTFGEAAPWLAFCLVASLAALPLALRMFRGLADRGVGLSAGIGIILTTWIAWLFSMEGFGGAREATFVRLVCLAGASLMLSLALLFRTRGYAGGNRIALFFPALALALVGLLPLPHSGFTIWFSLIIVAVASICCWLHDLPGLVAVLRRVAVPAIIAHFIFVVAFLFFVNVRSYIPWATFELSLYQAEKWGNYTHLQSILTSSHMPPKDIWFNGEPTNYYYGGHLVTATIAKATGTGPRAAFNLGLATIFALTMSMGFCFSLSLVHGATRKLRLPGGVCWHHGIGWGLVGMLAIGMFGNLDPWRQLFTRDVDYGVRIRWERGQRAAVEDWKSRNGLSPDRVQVLLAAVTAIPVDERPEAFLNELKRLEASIGDPAAQLNDLAGDVESRAAMWKQSPANSGMMEGVADSLTTTGSKRQLWQDQNGGNSIELEDEFFALVSMQNFDAIAKRLKEVAARQKSPAAELEALASPVRERMKTALDSQALGSLRGKLADEEYQDAVFSLFSRTPAALLDGIGSDAATANYTRASKTLTDVAGTVGAFNGQMSEKQAALSSDIREAFTEFTIDPLQVIAARFGTEFPTAPTNPTIGQIRFSWENATFVNFWDSSRAIKGTPGGVKEAGTITEFPYFSAILGDHHPHHAAIPFTLAALCACLSLLRKNSRGSRKDAIFFGRSWIDLGCMAFFIAAVFPVNIWDAVVLAPLYGVVILVARRGVAPAAFWKWVGFAGFAVLLALVVGALWNSMPDTTPLFQNFKLFLLAIVALAAGYPIIRFRLTHASVLSLAIPAIVVALALVMLGAFIAPGMGGAEPTPALGIAIRDAAILLAIIALAGSWALRPRENGVGAWWYSAGGTYAMVGGLSLAFILPFKLYFVSPLQPENTVFYDILPPFISHELKSATGRFWETFWKSSPVNPFPAALRTQLRDFVMHWGIFLIPIIALAIGRFARSARRVPRGVAFMAAMGVLAIITLTRNYLEHWAGAISLGMMVLAFYYAIAFKDRSESPAWTFLSVAFFWTWFVEALHFDDDYSGNLERYNTPFKIYYPIWAIFAGGMVVALREMFARFSVRPMTTNSAIASPELWTLIAIGGIGMPFLIARLFPEGAARMWFYLFWILAGILIVALVMAATAKGRSRMGDDATEAVGHVLARWPALVAVMAVLFLGMYYPLAATVTRTRDFFTWPIASTPEARAPHRDIYMTRTLDAIAHLGEYPRYREDYKAITWMEKNTPPGTRILERVDEVAYSHIGRISTGSGRTTILGWKHHESQWRGRVRPAPYALKVAYYDSVTGLADLATAFRAVLPSFSAELDATTQRSLRLSGGKERLAMLRSLVPGAGLMDLFRLRRVIEKNDVGMSLVMDAMMRDAGEMYRSPDKDKVARLMGRYRIQYVVVGTLEREGYGEGIEERLKGWGFTEVFRSNAPENRLPREEGLAMPPTVIFAVPADFPIKPERAE